MAKIVTGKKKKSSPKKRGKVILSPLIGRMLKRLAACSSKNSIQNAKNFYEYLHPNSGQERRLV